MATIQEHIANVKTAMLNVAEVEKHLNQMARQCNHEPAVVADKLQTVVEAVQDGFDSVVLALEVLEDSMHKHF